MRACVTSRRVVTGAEITKAVLARLDDDVPRWAIDCDDADEEKCDTPLGRYLRGELAKVAKETYLAKQRRPWFALERRDNCPILFTYFNKNNPRFVRNRALALPLNTWLIVEPNEGVDVNDLWARLRMLQAAQLSHAARVYGGGLWKLEPSELGQIVLPPS